MEQRLHGETTFDFLEHRQHAKSQVIFFLKERDVSLSMLHSVKFTLLWRRAAMSASCPYLSLGAAPAKPNDFWRAVNFTTMSKVVV